MIFEYLAQHLPPGLLFAAATMCPAPAAPIIDVYFNNTAPVYSQQKSSEQLGNYKSDTVISKSNNERFKTGGITQSQIRTSYTMETKRQDTLITGDSCAWVDHIKMTVSYDPIIYIANSYAPDSCRYLTTAEHELRHVNTDVITLNEYIAAIKKTLHQTASQLGNMAPFKTKDAEKQNTYFQHVIASVLKKSLDQLEILRVQRQQLVDTRQEYMRLTKACPGEKP